MKSLLPLTRAQALVEAFLPHISDPWINQEFPQVRGRGRCRRGRGKRWPAPRSRGRTHWEKHVGCGRPAAGQRPKSKRQGDVEGSDGQSPSTGGFNHAWKGRSARLLQRSNRTSHTSLGPFQSFGEYMSVRQFVFFSPPLDDHGTPGAGEVADFTGRIRARHCG